MMVHLTPLSLRKEHFMQCYCNNVVIVVALRQVLSKTLLTKKYVLDIAPKHHNRDGLHSSPK
jgi:hypothetical protein